MKHFFFFTTLIIPLTIFPGCNKKPSPGSGNHYKVTFKALRQNTEPAVGFRVEAWVKGKSEPQTKTTNVDGIVEWNDLPTPDATHQLNTVLHYYMKKKDQSREISYPFIESDATRLKDTQYIPNNATPDPQ
ncbi:MAG: hypothetical protein KCHDKBKB_01777 [Elusimicrobia bacterium]|nr:hypothetical protein [Elusimicrobiota bacterium]